MQKQTKAYLFAITAILFWSTIATAFKTALAGMSFANLLLVSTFTSVVALLAILIIQNTFFSTITANIKQYASSAILGFLNPFLYYMILLKAYSLLPAQIAQPLNYTWPVMLVLLSIPILKQKISNKAPKEHVINAENSDKLNEMENNLQNDNLLEREAFLSEKSKYPPPIYKNSFYNNKSDIFNFYKTLN